MHTSASVLLLLFVLFLLLFLAALDRRLAANRPLILALTLVRVVSLTSSLDWRSRPALLSSSDIVIILVIDNMSRSTFSIVPDWNSMLSGPVRLVRVLCVLNIRHDNRSIVAMSSINVVVMRMFQV